MESQRILCLRSRFLTPKPPIIPESPIASDLLLHHMTRHLWRLCKEVLGHSALNVKSETSVGEDHASPETPTATITPAQAGT